MTLEHVLTSFQIDTSDDVRTFLSWCIVEQRLGLGFHIDTPFGEYALESNGEAIYSAEQSAILDKKLESCIDLCRVLDLDIYEIAFDTLTAAYPLEEIDRV